MSQKSQIYFSTNPLFKSKLFWKFCFHPWLQVWRLQTKKKNPPWTQTILGQACVCHPWFKYFSLQLWLDHSVCHVRSMDCHDSSSRHQDGSHLWDRDHKEDPPAWHAALYDPSNKEVTLWSGHMTRCMKTLSAHSLCLSSSGTKGKSLAFPRGCLCFVTDQNNRKC